MNIFYVDSDPTKAAQALCDRHVIKMILESAQLLSSVHRLHPHIKIGKPLTDTLLCKQPYQDSLYHITHVNHPSAKWAREDIKNYDWLLKHALALCDEYNYRYGKIHKSLHILELCSKQPPNIKSNKFTEPPQCMPDIYKVAGDSVKAYRNYYKLEKMTSIDCRWTKRPRPTWI